MSHSDLLIRCDGSPELGMGHVVRCLAIAEAVVAQGHPAPAFLMTSSTLGTARVQAAGFQVYPVSAAHLSGSGFVHAVEMSGATTVCVDVRDALSRNDLERLRAEGVRIAVLDDASDRRLAADLAFYPPVPQVAALDWSGFSGEKLVGWEWIPLRSMFADCTHAALVEPPRLLVSLGATDPHGMTLPVLEVLAALDVNCQVRVVIGSVCPQRAEIHAALEHLPMPCECLEDVTDMAALMAEAGLAVVAFGMTAYELAACGVPALYLCASEDHAQSAAALVQAGAGFSLGVVDDGSTARLQAALGDVLGNRDMRRAMAARARALIDGRGAQRIAARLTERAPVRAQVRA